MKLIELNSIVPEMKNAPHKIYMLEFNHQKGELATFTLFPVDCLKQFPQFQDIDDKTNINKIGVEGDKGGRDHTNIKSTHALVVDFRPLGIYMLYWAKAETPKGFQTALKGKMFKNLLKE
jgi:hypothetical protein